MRMKSTDQRSFGPTTPLSAPEAARSSGAASCGPAKPTPGLQGLADATFDDIAGAAAAGLLRFDFLTASLGAHWKIAGSLLVTNKVDQDATEGLRFNPWNSHPSLVPAGPLNT